MNIYVDSSYGFLLKSVFHMDFWEYPVRGPRGYPQELTWITGGAHSNFEFKTANCAMFTLENELCTV